MFDNSFSIHMEFYKYLELLRFLNISDWKKVIKNSLIMGKCISTKEASVEVSKPTKDPNKVNSALASKGLTLFEQNLPEKFKDMPEIEDKYIGEGVRRMKAYKCDLKVDELQKLQDEFWSKISLKKVIE